MKRETLIWLIVFVVGGAGLLYNAAIRPGGMGKAYVKAKDLSAEHPEAGKLYVDVQPRERNSPDVSLSMPRTVGLWIAAFFTLCAFSFLYGDNPFYKLAEAVFVGTSAAYTMVQAFWAQLVPNLFGAIVPATMRRWSSPNIEDQVLWYRYIPLVLGVMLLWRLMPRGQWIARWPLAVVIGTMAGIQLVVFIQSDLLSQVRNTIVPLVVVSNADAPGKPGPSSVQSDATPADIAAAAQPANVATTASAPAKRRVDIEQSVLNTVTVASVMLCLLYFFFSIEHKGAVGKAARMGMWVLMIAFGASFALTVMGRITLLTDRIAFLVDDWLWLIDPGNTRSIISSASLLLG